METSEVINNVIPFEENGQYHLSIQINTTSFIYAILDIQNKRYIGLKHYEIKVEEKTVEEIKNILDNDKSLQYSFQSSSLQYQSFRAMLVPESLFDSKNLKSFLKFHHDVDDKDHIHFYNLKLAEAFVIYSLPVVFENIFVAKFPKIQFSHSSIPFIYNALYLKDKNEPAPCLHIHFAEDFFDVLIVRNAKIQLFNSFFFKKYTDVIYFVVNILNLFSLKPDHSKVFLSGDIEEGSELKKELEKIFKPIQFEKFSLDFSYTPDILNLQQHTYINLLNNYSCV